jgi:hypothetical protein
MAGLLAAMISKFAGAGLACSQDETAPHCPFGRVARAKLETTFFAADFEPSGLRRENVTQVGFRWITWARLLTAAVSSATSWNVLVEG